MPTATTRYVHAKQGVRTGQFNTPAKAARTVGAALKAAADGDTIVILDNATYHEDELIIDKALTLTSQYLKSHPATDPGDPRFDKRVPTLAPKKDARHRVLRVSGTAKRNAGKKLGPVVVSGVRITRGHAIHRPGGPDPAFGAGGGIAVIDTDDVRIERCVITGCRTESAPFGAWKETDRLDLRKDLTDLVDALLPASVVATLNGVIGMANVMISHLPGGVPTIPLIDTAKIKKLIETEFDGYLPRGHPIMWLAGQAFGGGVAAIWSSVTIRNCRIQGNHAEGRGSGIAVVGYGWPTVDNCLIDGNSSGGKGRLDGGGIGAEISLPGKLPRDLSELELINFLRSKAKAVGASFASSAFTSAALPGPIEMMKFVYWLFDPTQPPVITGNAKRLYLFLINGHKDSEQLFKQLFYMFATTALSLGRWDAWVKTDIEAARTRSVTVRNSKIIGNACGDGGGGVYCSVLSRISLTHCLIEGNKAPGEGGGVRLTMGSAGAIADCFIDGNVCGTGPDPMSKPKPGKPSVRIPAPGGGGISARNVDLTLTGTLVGSTGGGGTPAPTGNLTSDHPGGGVLVYADTEGDMGGIPDMWTSILHEVFEVKAVQVSIDGSCLISGNGAGFRPGAKPIPKVLFAKGGGVFLLHGTFPDAPEIEVSIADVGKTVSGNIAQLHPYTSRVVPNLLITSAHDICIQDLKGGREWTEINDKPLIKSGTLHWP